MLALLSAGALADFPPPLQAGFHHCALIYDKQTRGVPELMPFVARTQNGKAREWLFDAFLFLVYSSPAGTETSDGRTVRADWQYQLDRWFTKERDLDALDLAIEKASGDLGPLPSRRRIMLAIPYPNPGVKDFGDVDGDGKSEDLSTAEGRETVLRWYLDTARKRFAAAHYRHLELWGFYWMREEMAAEDEPMVRQTANLVHRDGNRFFWIPYFNATGWNRWRSVGVDVAVLQPNFAFNSIHHGDVRRNRLAANAAMARIAGMGVEVEFGEIRDPRDRFNFRCYLADGAAKRLGFQQAATAYYLGDDGVEQMLAAKEPLTRRLYDFLADYVAGRSVPDPSPAIRWTTPPMRRQLGSDYLSAGRAVESAEARFANPGAVSHVDVFLDEPKSSAGWRGSVEVTVRKKGESRWSPGGWAIRTTPDPAAGKWQVVSVPVGQTVVGLSVRLTSLNGGAPARVRAIVPEFSEQQAPFHLAQFRPYEFLPAPQGAYPDDGRKLTDGVISRNGFADGKNVGWLLTSASVLFDLGSVRNVSRVDVFCLGGGVGAVTWPVYACALLGERNDLPSVLTARGPLPPKTDWVPPEPVKVYRIRKPGDVDGLLSFRLKRPTRARYVRLLFRPQVWMMLSEVRIFADGVNVAPKSRYTLTPAPTPGTDPESWADDGHRITDGVIAQREDSALLTGWSEGDQREVLIDLQSVVPVRSITAWSLGGGRGGIFAPAEAVFDISSDGKKWTSFGSVGKPNITEDGSNCSPLAYRVQAAEKRARYVRVRVLRSRGSAMLSEIAVE